MRGTRGAFSPQKGGEAPRCLGSARWTGWRPEL